MMPQMGAAFRGWLSKITIIKIIQKIIDNGLVEESELMVSFDGVIQPLSAQKLMLKPEELRSWVWLQIHCFSTGLNLATNDKIMYNCKQYKIMGKYDYSLNGFVEYHAVEDFRDA